MPVRGALAVLVQFLCVLFAGCTGSSDPAGKETGNIVTDAWSDGGPGNPVLLQRFGDPASSDQSAWPDVFQSAVTAYDFDGDGRDEFVGHSDDAKVYVFRADGHILAALPTKYPPAWHVDTILNGVAVGVMEPGEPPSIVVTNHAAFVAQWRFLPSESGKREFVFEKQWERRMDACHRSPGMDSRPTLADLDRDGSLEVLVQPEEMGLFALDGNGAILWKQCWAGGNSAPAADDIDGDGDMEALFASDSGFIAVFDGRTGQPQWTFDAADRRYGIAPASVVVTPTIADLDGQMPKEVLFTARHAPADDPDRFDEFNLAIFAVRQNPATWQSELVWLRQPTWANPLSNTQLVVADVDGSGPSVFGMDWNTIGHRPGDWEVLGAAHVFRLDARGRDVWVRELDAWWSNKDIALADADGDGGLDVLVNGVRAGHDGVWRLSAETGKAEGFLGLGPWKMVRGPVLVDSRHDGRMQLVFPVQPVDGPAERGTVLLIDLGVPYRAPWRGAP